MATNTIAGVSGEPASRPEANAYTSSADPMMTTSQPLSIATILAHAGAMGPRPVLT